MAEKNTFTSAKKKKYIIIKRHKRKKVITKVKGEMRGNNNDIENNEV